MVALEAVRASNAKIRNLPSSLTAVFVGGTSGIGEATAKLFCRQAVNPRIYIVGRNEEAGKRILSELKTIKSDGSYNFIRKDVSSLKNVDQVCSEIKSKEQKINLLFMTQGVMSLKGRNENEEGLDRKLSAHYYSRIRFIQQLLPELEAAKPQLSRVVSIFSAGYESSSIDFDDLGLKKRFSLKQAADHAVVMTDFAFEELAKQHPDVSFVHRFPGGVNTGWMKEQNMLLKAAAAILMVGISPLLTSVEECAERSLYAASSNRYPPKNGTSNGVDAGGEAVLKGSDESPGSGAYLIGANGEYNAKEKVLRQLRKLNAGAKVWSHTMAEFDRIGNLE